MIVLVFDEPTPSINVHYGHHWSKKHALRNRWWRLTQAALRRSSIFIPPKWPKAKIRIERYGPRILDADNCRAGMKALIDALVHEGVITDDNPGVIGEPEIKQFAGKERGTRVYVEAVCENA